MDAPYQSVLAAQAQLDCRVFHPLARQKFFFL
jgi:hypothetical protein